MAPLVFTMVIYTLVLNDPASRISIILSEIPFFAPVLMPLRVSLQTPPMWQMALSIGLLFLSIVAVIYFSAKILSRRHPDVRQAAHASPNSGAGSDLRRKPVASGGGLVARTSCM